MLWAMSDFHNSSCFSNYTKYKLRLASNDTLCFSPLPVKDGESDNVFLKSRIFYGHIIKGFLCVGIYR